MRPRSQFADKGGTRQERTEWHNITVWGKQGEACAQYLKKGSSVYIEGRISYREYEAKDGSGKRKATDIVAMRVQFLSSRGGAPAGDDAEVSAAAEVASRQAQAVAVATTSRRWTTKTSRSSPRLKACIRAETRSFNPQMLLLMAAPGRDCANPSSDALKTRAESGYTACFFA